MRLRAKCFRIGRSVAVVVPKQVRDTLGLGPESVLELDVVRGRLVAWLSSRKA